MKNWIQRIITGACALVFLAGCGSREEKSVLNLYNWDDYMSPEVLALFEEKYDCEIILDTFDSNEAMYAKLKAGAAGYDVIFPSSYQAYIMKEEGMLLPLDRAQLPNLANVDATFLDDISFDSAMLYSVPYHFGSTGIAYRGDKLGEVDPSWGIYNREDLRGRMILLDDMREVIGGALKFLGYSLNTTDQSEIDEAVQVVLGWKRNIAKFENEGYKQGIASGEFFVVQGYGGDVSQVIEENEEAGIVYFVPQEGFSIWVDDMVIPTTADNVELAHAFINFMHDPEIAKMNMEHNYYVCPNTPAYEMIDPELREDDTVFIPEEMMKRAEQIRPLGEDLAKYTAAWDRIKAE